MGKYYWIAKCNDGNFDVRSEKNFYSEEEAYNDMRNAALEKMKWNTNYKEDVSCLDDDSYIGYRVEFFKNKIVHDSYSGTYTWELKCKSDIMDTYNGHNKDLVRKINDAWNNEMYHDSFGDILYALLMRDYDEYEDKYCDIPKDADIDYAIDHANEIMEGVCDDWDLETILSFIRYEE